MRKVFWIAGGLISLVVAASVGVCWYFAGVAITPDHNSVYDLTVEAIDDETVTLTRRRELLFPGTYDVYGEGSRAVLGDVVASTGTDADGGSVTRRLERVSEGSLAVGDNVAWGANIFSGDPKSTVGLAFQEVTYPSPVGDMPAWVVPGAARGDRGAEKAWVVGVHGINGSREDFLRMLPSLHEAGYTVVLPSYRNDVGAPAAPDERWHLGYSEWQDIDAALTWAKGQGARSFVLMGQSMGGAVSLQVADQGANADAVAGLVLDSPAVDWRLIFDAQAAQRGLPGPLVGLAELFVEQRVDINLDTMDWVARADEVSVQTLILHGPDDLYVPWGGAVAMADKNPAMVQLVRIDQAEHVRGWNVDPDAYDANVLAFLATVAP